jgi:hypothetical protein
MGETLTYSTTNRSGYKEYRTDPAKCSVCPLLEQWTSTKQRTIQRHVWEDFKEQVLQNRQSETGAAVYRLRSQTIERSFADAKELHGLRRCRFHGRNKTQLVWSGRSVWNLVLAYFTIVNFRASIKQLYFNKI